MQLGTDDQGRITLTMRPGHELVILGSDPLDTVTVVHAPQRSVDDGHHITIRCEGITA